MITLVYLRGVLTASTDVKHFSAIQQFSGESKFDAAAVGDMSCQVVMAKIQKISHGKEWGLKWKSINSCLSWNSSSGSSFLFSPWAFSMMFANASDGPCFSQGQSLWWAKGSCGHAKQRDAKQRDLFWMKVHADGDSLYLCIQAALYCSSSQWQDKGARTMGNRWPDVAW